MALLSNSSCFGNALDLVKRSFLAFSLAGRCLKRLRSLKSIQAILGNIKDVIVGNLSFDGFNNSKYVISSPGFGIVVCAGIINCISQDFQKLPS